MGAHFPLASLWWPGHRADPNRQPWKTKSTVSLPQCFRVSRHRINHPSRRLLLLAETICTLSHREDTPAYLTLQAEGVEQYVTEYPEVSQSASPNEAGHTAFVSQMERGGDPGCWNIQSRGYKSLF